MVGSPHRSGSFVWFPFPLQEWSRYESGEGEWMDPYSLVRGVSACSPARVNILSFKDEKATLGKQEWMDPYSVMRGVSACSCLPYIVLNKIFEMRQVTRGNRRWAIAHHCWSRANDEEGWDARARQPESEIDGCCRHLREM